jgi:hypothetical protein
MMIMLNVSDVRTDCKLLQHCIINSQERVCKWLIKNLWQKPLFTHTHVSKSTLVLGDQCNMDVSYRMTDHQTTCWQKDGLTACSATVIFHSKIFCLVLTRHPLKIFLSLSTSHRWILNGGCTVLYVSSKSIKDSEDHLSTCIPALQWSNLIKTNMDQ